MTNVQLELATADRAQVITNLWPLYQHDVSAFERTAPNQHGIFNSDEGVVSLDEHANSLGPWWNDPESLFPYLIEVDGAPAGFNFVAARDRLPSGIDADFVVHEFFVLHAYRGTEVAERAAIAGFERHSGSWEIVTWVDNVRAIAFWRRAIGTFTAQRFSEDTAIDHPWGPRVRFRFDTA
ncbi:hypothetical protein Pla163_08660 [Planctomycetes bacterium Pla163]|uniref:N-acetyltransferase domain-containing protein n=1 Tax=Rohdeia mirabilis TaxID=2528008 RepID=A0A518CX17_9BACT|nr:hypothetical protein Pla163_08660 [Planctomycetes bacterium Pla163]